MKGMRERKRHMDMCAALNWQIAQEERRIHADCSFFVFVGPIEAFLRARQIIQSANAGGIGLTPVLRFIPVEPRRRTEPTPRTMEKAA